MPDEKSTSLKLSLPQVTPPGRVDPHVSAVGQNPVAHDSAATAAAAGVVAPGMEALHARVVAALRGVFDPELPVNIYDLGLIYAIDIAADKSVHIRMTLTAPACPVAGSMPGMVERAVRQTPEISDAKVELVWDPPWTRERMSDVALLELGLL